MYFLNTSLFRFSGNTTGIWLTQASIHPTERVRSYAANAQFMYLCNKCMTTASYQSNASHANSIVLVSAHVTNLTLSVVSGVATVGFIHDGANHEVSVTKEVILSACSSSPIVLVSAHVTKVVLKVDSGVATAEKIMELSGIEDPNVLMKAYIDVKVVLLDKEDACLAFGYFKDPATAAQQFSDYVDLPRCGGTSEDPGGLWKVFKCPPQPAQRVAKQEPSSVAAIAQVFTLKATRQLQQSLDHLAIDPRHFESDPSEFSAGPRTKVVHVSGGARFRRFVRSILDTMKKVLTHVLRSTPTPSPVFLEECPGTRHIKHKFTPSIQWNFSAGRIDHHSIVFPQQLDSCVAFAVADHGTARLNDKNITRSWNKGKVPTIASASRRNEGAALRVDPRI
ncbi:hypothetical protein DFH07DRAFT_784825 [Mycena maculata]|uniref:Uncharacterized protein n=1 Tax=Mycena maculata TaxID=230809 RepID=A0AAD7MI84_9AGAR|nr:hypothetical protein DFH07DRAFT_784825 [Mycena maculata]